MAQKPLISVIVPCRNEEGYIRECLVSLVSQDIKAPYEIIVVEGMSEDKTLEGVLSLQDRYPNKIRVIRNQRKITPVAWNLGLKKARGKFFVMFGGHSWAPRDFLRKLDGTFRSVSKVEPKLVGVGGRLRCVGDDFLSRTLFLATNSFFGGGVSRYRFSSTPSFVDTVPSGFYLAEVVKKVGSYDERLLIGEDWELNYRLRANGYRLYYNPAICFNYAPRKSVPALLKQTFRYGFYRAEILLMHPGSFRLVYALPIGLCGYLLLVVVGGCRLGYWLLPALVYLVSLGVFSVVSSVQNRFFGVLLPVIYLLIHLSFGLGEVIGFITKSSRRQEC